MATDLELLARRKDRIIFFQSCKQSRPRSEILFDLTEILTSIRFRLGSHGLIPQIELVIGSVSIALPLLISCIGVDWIVS
jgi:hypothetical protein